MPPKALPPLPAHAFPTAAAFTDFLAKQHANLPGISLHLARAASGIPSITLAIAVEVALCFGWIDGRAGAIDSTRWSVRFTPRRPRSTWSAKNVATAERLIQEGRMQPPGMQEVEAARADGRWARAYGGMRDMKMPEDLRRAIEDAGLLETWEGCGKGVQFTLLVRLVNAKGRENCLLGIVKTLAGKRKEADQDAPELEEVREKETGRKRTAAVLDDDRCSRDSDDTAKVSRRKGLRPRT